MKEIGLQNLQYLNLYEDYGIRVGKGNVTKSLQTPPHLLSWGHQAYADSCKAPFQSPMLYISTELKVLVWNAYINALKHPA